MAEARYLISDAARQVRVEAHVLRYWEDELELAIPRNDMGHRYYTDYHIRLFCRIRDLKEQGYQLKAIRNALNKMSGAMEDITITEDLMEEEMKAAWKENHERAELTKENAGCGTEGDNETDGQAVHDPADGSRVADGSRAADDTRPADGSRVADGSRPADGSRTAVGDTDRAGTEMSGTDGDPSGTSGAAEALHLVPAQTDRPAEILSPDEKMDRFREIMNHIIGQAVEANMIRISREITEDVSDAVSENVTDRVMKEVEYLLRVSDEKEEERFKQLDETIRAYQNKRKGRAEAAAAKAPFFRKKRFGRSGRKMF